MPDGNWGPGASSARPATPAKVATSVAPTMAKPVLKVGSVESERHSYAPWAGWKTSKTPGAVALAAVASASAPYFANTNEGLVAKASYVKAMSKASVATASGYAQVTAGVASNAAKTTAAASAHIASQTEGAAKAVAAAVASYDAAFSALEATTAAGNARTTAGVSSNFAKANAAAKATYIEVASKAETAAKAASASYGKASYALVAKTKATTAVGEASVVAAGATGLVKVVSTSADALYASAAGAASEATHYIATATSQLLLGGARLPDAHDLLLPVFFLGVGSALLKSAVVNAPSKRSSKLVKSATTRVKAAEGQSYTPWDG